jgi:hypothetical protein
MVEAVYADRFADLEHVALPNEKLLAAAVAKSLQESAARHTTGLNGHQVLKTSPWKREGRDRAMRLPHRSKTS